MFLVGIFQWWYGDGLKRHTRLTSLGILRTADFFSVGLLLKTLFNPFRQISAGKVQGALPVQFQAFLDRLFSRIIGAIVRTIIIIVGIIVLALRVLWSLISIIGWVILPLAPIIGIILWQMKVVVI